MTATIDDLVKDINTRLAAIGESVSEARLTQLVNDSLDRLTQDEAFVRKIRFRGGDEALIGSKFSRWGLDASDIEFLYDVQVSLKGQRRVSLDGFYGGPSEELTKAFRNVSDAFYLSEDEIRQIDKRALDNTFPRIRKVGGGWTRPAGYADAARAMDSAESGFGQQLIGAQYVRELWDAARTESRVFALIDSFEMTDPVAYVPVEVDIPEPLYVGENTANNSADYTTVKTGSNRVQVNARKFVIHQMWSGELEEDSIVPFVPFLRRQATLSLAHYSDALVLNGDETNAPTGNINLVDADPADTKYYLAFDGIRHAALVDNVANALNATGPVTLAMLRNLRGLMLDPARLIDWGHPTSLDDLVYVADPETADRIATLDEVIKVRQTFGPSANLLSGEVGRVIGHPTLSSMAVAKTDATGRVSATPTNNTTGQVVAFNRRGFKVGWRRRVKVETERLPARDQTRIVYSFRMGLGRFTPTGAASGIESAAVAYNVSLA